MVSFNFLNTLLALSTVTAVTAGPNLGNWGESCREFYGSGATFWDINAAKNDLARACYGWPGNRGFYQDMYFKPWNQSPYTAKLCINQGGGTKLDVEIGNLNPNTGFNLRPDDCWKELNALTYTTRGGDEQQSGWYFRVDPNDGYC